MVNFILSDDELIYLIKQNNQEAYRLLFLRYEKNMVSMLKKIDNYLYQNIDQSTLCSLYMESFDKAIKIYDNKKGVFFYFFKELFRFELIKYYRTTLINIEREILNYDENDNNVPDFLEDINYAENIDVSMILELLKKDDEVDYLVVSYWMMGYKYKEISKTLKMNDKQIYYILDRSIKKIRRILKLD